MNTNENTAQLPCPTCGAHRGLGRATLSDLETLHGMLGEVLLDELTKQQQKTGARNGSSRLMSVVLAFLRDNGVTTPHQAQRAVNALLAEMPEFDDAPTAGESHE